MTKRIALLAVALALCAGFAFAEPYATDGMLITPGSLNVNVGIGYGYAWGIDIGGGAEFAIGKFVIGDTLPFTYGVAARAGIGVASSYFPISLAGLGTLHFCWGAIPWPTELAWLGNIDSYLGLGLQILPGIGFNSIGGTSYFFNKNLAVNFEGGLRSSYIGILFKF